eukprot:595264-Rhodomonas_salina.4
MPPAPGEEDVCGGHWIDVFVNGGQYSLAGHMVQALFKLLAGIVPLSHQHSATDWVPFCDTSPFGQACIALSPGQ